LNALGVPIPGRSATYPEDNVVTIVPQLLNFKLVYGNLGVGASGGQEVTFYEIQRENRTPDGIALLLRINNNHFIPLLPRLSTTQHLSPIPRESPALQPSLRARGRESRLESGVTEDVIQRATRPAVIYSEFEQRVNQAHDEHCEGDREGAVLDEENENEDYLEENDGCEVNPQLLLVHEITPEGTALDDQANGPKTSKQRHTERQARDASSVVPKVRASS